MADEPDDIDVDDENLPPGKDEPGPDEIGGEIDEAYENVDP